MSKLSLTAIGLYLGILSAFSQTPADTSVYKSKKLKINEVNFVTGYYNQNGNRSPVTGGIGTEKLSDISTTIELKLSRYDRHNRKHEANAEIGVDHYSSASSDNIDPYALSSASRSDNRIYPTLSYSITNEQKGNAVNAAASFSGEYDYESYGGAVGFTKTSKNKNTEFDIKLQAYFDKVFLILPLEMRKVMPGPRQSRNYYPTTPRNSYSSTFTFTRVINQRLQLAILLELVAQQGYLGTSFHRIYFNNGKVTNEKLPDTRFKVPAAIRLNYFAGDKFIIRSYYRFYKDDWGLTAHTFNIETPVKLTSFFSVSPFYRYYTQNGVRYYAGYMQHSPKEQFYTTDDDLSVFNSHSFGAGFRFSPPGGIAHLKHFNTAELRYGRYMRTDGLNANNITLALKFK